MKPSQTHQNLIHQALGQGLGKVITLIYSLILPRLLGISSYGKFSFFYSICILIIQPVIELGLDLIMVKSIVQGDSTGVSSILALKSISSLITGVIIVFLTLKLGWPSLIIYSFYFYIVMTSIQRTCFAYQRGQENMKLESMAMPAERILCVLFSLALYSCNCNLDLIAPYSLLISTFITTIPVLYSCRSWLTDGLYRPLLKSNLFNMFREGIYLAGISILGLIYFRIDSIMIGIFSDFNEVASYNAAFRLLEGLIYFPSVLMTVYFPKLVKSQQEFSIYFPKLLRALILMGFILTLSIFAFSGLIIKTVYGEEWNSSILILRSLSLSLFPICIGHLVTQSLVAKNFQKPYFWMVCSATLENILLNLLLIPQFHALGASISTFLTELSITSLCLYWLYSRGAIAPHKPDKC
jgi:O-antigen/teichoic acid export membrane protein